MAGKSGLAAARRATVEVVAIRGDKEEHRGQGLMPDF